MMNFPRRRFLQMAGAVALASLSRPANAQNFPSRIVRLVVGFPPGGGADLAARIVANRLLEIWGQQVIVENRPGAGARIALDTVAHAAPDGYTMLLAPGSPEVNRFLFSSLTFDPAADFAPVSLVGTFPDIIVVPNSSSFKTLEEFIAYAKANPGKISYASAGIGTPQHVSAELFKMMTGVEMVHVPYRGAAPALTDLLGGQVQIDTSPASMQHIRSGKVRALAVTTATRADVLPDLPTVSEFLPGYEATSWFGIGVTRNTPPEIIEKLNKEINAGLADPKISARLKDLGGIIIPGSPADFGKLIAGETEKWAKVVKFSGAKAN